MEGTNKVDNLPVGVDKKDKSASINDGRNAESQSATSEDSKGTKRKRCDDFDKDFLSKVITSCDKMDSEASRIRDTIRVLRKQLAANVDAAQKSQKVYDILSSFAFCSVKRVHVAQYLYNNSNLMDMFLTWPDKLKEKLVRNIIEQVGGGAGFGPISNWSV